VCQLGKLIGMPCSIADYAVVQGVVLGDGHDLHHAEPVADVAYILVNPRLDMIQKSGHRFSKDHAQ